MSLTSLGMGSSTMYLHKSILNESQDVDQLLRQDRISKEDLLEHEQNLARFKDNQLYRESSMKNVITLALKQYSDKVTNLQKKFAATLKKAERVSSCITSHSHPSTSMGKTTSPAPLLLIHDPQYDISADQYFLDLKKSEAAQKQELFFRASLSTERTTPSKNEQTKDDQNFSNKEEVKRMSSKDLASIRAAADQLMLKFKSTDPVNLVKSTDPTNLDEWDLVGKPKRSGVGLEEELLPKKPSGCNIS